VKQHLNSLSTGSPRLTSAAGPLARHLEIGGGDGGISLAWKTFEMFRFKLLMSDTAFASGVCLATCMGAALCRDSRFEDADTADAFCLSTTCTGSALLRDSTMPRLKVLTRNRYGVGIVLSDTMAENVSQVSRSHEYIHTGVVFTEYQAI